MFLGRASSLFRRIRFPVRTAAARRDPALHSSVPMSSNLKFFNQVIPSFAAWSKHHGDLTFGVIISVQAAFILGIHNNIVLAEDTSTSEFIPEDDKVEAHVTGLRRIEDGSVVSNSHTAKWRIYTDNGRDLFLKGKLDEAEKYFILALQEAKEGFGERDPHVASSCNNLAELYRVKKAFEKAEPLYLDAISMLEESFGLEDIRVGAALHNLGQFYLVQRNFEKARICYERALKIKGRVLGYGHTDYADTMFHLGTVLHLQGKDKDSEALIQDSIRILEEGGLGESAICVRRMRYLSQILLKSNRLIEVENLERKILHILELSKGWPSLDTVNAAEKLALTLLSLGKLQEAQDLLERCLDTRKNIFHEDHIQVVANMLHLARIAMLKSNHLKKVSISDAIAELDKAKLLLDNSMRIARKNLGRAKENQSNLKNSEVLRESGKDEHTVLILLLQSLDAIGLLEVYKREIQEPKEAHTIPIEAELALRECISIFKQPGMLSLLNSADVKAEYLSCLKRLMSNVRENYGNGRQQSTVTLQELENEVKHIEAYLSPIRKHRS